MFLPAGFKNSLVIEKYILTQLLDQVCCLESQRGETGITSGIVTTPIPPPKISNLLPIPGSNACGIDSSDRIYGGNVTKIDEYPWLALLEYTKRESLQ